MDFIFMAAFNQFQIASVFNQIPVRDDDDVFSGTVVGIVSVVERRNDSGIIIQWLNRPIIKLCCNVIIAGPSTARYAMRCDGVCPSFICCPSVLRRMVISLRLSKIDPYLLERHWEVGVADSAAAFTSCLKKLHFCFCQNFVKFPWNLISFGR